MRSLWEQTSEPHRFESLSGDYHANDKNCHTDVKNIYTDVKNIHTDVLIIGGGMAGVLCAQLLHQEGVDYVLVEAETIGSGITGNTTAKITSQHGLIYDRLLRRFGAERARQYLDINQMALGKYRELCRNMDCDFQEKASYVYTLNDLPKIEREARALEKLGFPAEVVKPGQAGSASTFSRTGHRPAVPPGISPSHDPLPLPFPVVGAVKFPGQAQFHPLKFLTALAEGQGLSSCQASAACPSAEGLHIYEHTRVKELIGTTAVTDNGCKIAAQKIIIATHFPFLNKHGSYFLKLYQHRSYVIALENAPDVEGMYVDEAEKGLSFRNYGDLLLIGGGDHRTGKKGGGWQELRDFAGRHYPQAKEKYYWAAQDCMPLDDVPYIGLYSARTENLYVATGFHKWGMTSSMAAAMILCDLVQGKRNPYAEVFSPSRTILRPQLMTNALEAAVNLLTPTARRCPHLGCALKWNPLERTWDCPCHGSRFTENGRLMDNPATGDLPRR